VPTLRAALLAIALLGAAAPLAACGTCVFGIEGGNGCYWAVEIDGEHYWVQGVEPQDAAEAHGPEGMCSMARKAVVSGHIEGDRFLPDRFDLLPVDGTEQPAASHAHAH